jgi:N-acetylmuramoyl-L-alanine amidase CwlA
MVDYPGAIDMMLPTSYSFNFVVGKKIVCHCTGGDMDLQSLYNTFYSTMRSTHFGIDRNGAIAQFVPLSRGAGGNCCPDRDASGNLLCSSFWVPLVQQYGNLNLCTISIEHCNDSNNSLPLTTAQQKASNNLILWLCRRYGLTTDDIHSHKSIDPVSKPLCPGPAFDFNQLFTFINEQGKIVNTQEQSIQDHFLSYFRMMQQKDSSFTLPPINTGIYQTYHDLYIKGIELGPATSYEYSSVDWGGLHVTCQDFGSYRIVWTPNVGPYGVYGPTHIALP